MSLESKVESRKYHLRLYNSRTTDLLLFLEPEGMSFNVPPDAAYNIIFTQKEDDVIEVNFSEDKEKTPYLSIGIWDFGQVYNNGVRIHP